MKKDSTLRGTAPGAIRPDPHRNFVHALPARRSQPLLMTQWKYLWREEFVELRRGGRVTATGWVDDLTADGAIIWIRLKDGRGRAMIHRDDGLDIWRIDSRIFQNRSPSDRQEPTRRRRSETPAA
jgi:hypothetical protein